MATMNISRQNIIGVCNLKCNLSFKYPTSNCSATNYGNMIRLTYDNGTSPPVKYNNSEYNVRDVSIVSPSRHLYNGQEIPGELYINHNSTTGAPALVICMPIIKGNEGNKMLEDIIGQVSTGAANSGESTIIKTDYNLDNIVPMKPFFNYTKKNEEIVVFGLIDALSINTVSTNSLKGLITDLPKINGGYKLYVNTTGPNRSLNDGQIYIDCKPTGSSEETTDIEQEKSTPTINFSMDDILKSPIFLFLVGCLIFFILIFGFNVIVSYATGTKIPALSELQKKLKPKDS
jgi:carbonic anhydrase